MIEWQPYPLEGAGAPGQVALWRLPDVLSPQLRNYRDITVALPPSYQAEGAGYPVVYMQDGQNLFDPAASFAGDWGLVSTLESLARDDVRAIVVGIPNSGRRRRYEYSPFRDIINGGGGGDRYLAFLVETVKPLVDGSFRTRPDRAHTVIAGSSLGGLISLYGLYRYADYFGAAGVFSPALWFADGAMLDFARGMAPLSVGRIHLDVGADEGEEAVMDVRTLREILLAGGQAAGRNLSYLEEAGADHDEAAWGRRFRAALPFLLGREE
ncbi:MAG: alpha/beta hydrolase [Gemmatimonadales bacterium]|nr:alpha/beta hydrolase [Gemmatimonadales bacterium]